MRLIGIALANKLTVLFSLAVDRSRADTVPSVSGGQYFHRVVREFLKSMKNGFAASSDLGVFSLLIYRI